MYYKRLYIQDMGGLPTIDGTSIREGLIFRSNDLNRIKEEEMKRLKSIPIKHIIDLRQEKYVYKYPDRYIAEVVTHLPVEAAEFKGVTPLKIFLRRVDWESYHLDRIYIAMLEQNREKVAKFFHALVDRPRPVLVHCTAGKDRAAVFTALFQYALGTSLEDILSSYQKIQDHLEENLFFYIKALSKITPLPDIVLSIDVRNLENLLLYIKDKFENMNNFLRSVGFDRLDELRRLYLIEIEP